MSFTIHGKHTEGTQFKTLARVVGTDNSLLTPESAGALTVDVFLRSFGGPLVYHNLISDTTATGIQDTGQAGEGWTQSGVWNFRYVWSPATLLTGAPPFTFKAPGTYAIRYTFASPVFEDVKVLHIQQVQTG